MPIGKLAIDIIKEQSLIIGEQLARTRAEATGAVVFSSQKIEEATVSEENPADTLGKLITSYELVFGRASVEVCIDVIKRYPFQEVSAYIPDSLKREFSGQ
ncbi:hypothetical protein A3K01_01625 [candidate division WWE3 bacterium RIFOXYD1_FULL_43_17]|uniref:Uncharacterized protein n=3 Tax=Katanobacteria TaxID=422282 RepID=A0A1F4XFQ4_UNCKA|nr:MAG: hypothetical protein UU59_C0012G0013 [candidate division WWE3 bacterium GW2011_GWE1_41_27]KKS59259.1 MAG: hypothetical protein UV26_C0026G0014 [candidate division WWE3 bacterium GW2011_GWF2_42_42]OGC80517.1 MAG: hypothetical protein A3K01_01625 [candidate division WWE3 bacterium RIFOXYD1_FULL_43_17]